MKSDDEIRAVLMKAMMKKIKRTFSKRQFKDNFSEEEMVKIKEIDAFLKSVNYNEDKEIDLLSLTMYTCIVFKCTYVKKDGTEIYCFLPRFINQENFHYKKIPYYIAKCIYVLSLDKHIEVFYTVNSLRAFPNKNNRYIPNRRRENLISSKAIYVDIDLPDKMAKYSNEAVISALKLEYEELFINLPPSWIVRSGGGCHLYYTFDESISFRQEGNHKLYMKMLKNLQILFESFGADARCVDAVRILRVPNCINRKPKYGNEGKPVSIIYQSDNTYDVQELDGRLEFLLKGGMQGLFESVAEEIFADDSFIEESDTEELTVIEDDEDDEEIVLVKIEDIAPPPTEAKISERTGKLLDSEYKGVQRYYDYNEETYFQGKDIMMWLQNRENHQGLRTYILFFMNYIWYVYNRAWTYEDMLERSKKLNAFFKPSLSVFELERQVKHNYENLSSKKHYNRSIRNTTLQSYLHFTEEEKKNCCIGLYCETYEGYLKARREKNREYGRDCYTKKLEEEGCVRRTERKENFKNILKENPLMKYEEFFELTGLSIYSYRAYQKECGNTGARHRQLTRDYYLEPFKQNPQITCEEYMRLLNCASSTFRKYRKMYRDGIK